MARFSREEFGGKAWIRETIGKDVGWRVGEESVWGRKERMEIEERRLKYMMNCSFIEIR